MKKYMSLAAAVLAAAMAFSLTACGGGGSAASSSAASAADGGKPVLKVAMSADYAPFDWLQNDDSNGAFKTTNGSYMNGYDVLMAQKIADALDMKLEITQVEWDGLILSITSGKVDCAIAGMSITSERSQSVDFTKPYYNADIVAVVASDGPYANAKNLTDFKGARLTSAMNTVWYDVLDQVKDYASKEAALDTFAAMVSAVKAGKIDGFTCDYPSAKSVLMSNDGLTIIDFKGGTGFEVSKEETDLGIPCKKGNTELVDKINAVLDSIPQEERDKMMDQAVASQPASQN